jgi:enediyne polyketide synthase
VSNERIAIVGVGLRYPDANSPERLWENVLAGRRALRRLPDERMNHDLAEPVVFAVLSGEEH